MCRTRSASAGNLHVSPVKLRGQKLLLRLLNALVQDYGGMPLFVVLKQNGIRQATDVSTMRQSDDSRVHGWFCVEALIGL